MGFVSLGLAEPDRVSLLGNELVGITQQRGAGGDKQCAGGQPWELWAGVERSGYRAGPGCGDQ